MLKKSKIILSAFKVPIDYLLVSLAFILAYYTRTQSSFSYIWDFNDFLKFTLSISPVWVIIFALLGVYNPKVNSFKAPGEITKIIIGNLAGTLIAMSWIFLSRTDFFSRLVIFYALTYSIIFLTLSRILLLALQRYLYQYEIGAVRLAVIGKRGIARVFINNLKRDKTHGYLIVRTFDNFNLGRISRLLSGGIDEVVLADPLLSDNQIHQILEFCEERGIGFKIIPSLLRVQMTKVDMSVIAGIPVIEYRRTPLDGWGAIAKRICDIFGSISLMIIFSPIFLFAAIGIKFTSPGAAVILRQKRVGVGGNFIFLKFRSMVPDAHLMHKKLIKQYGNMFKLKNDPRVIPFGRFLRQYSIDELPQLWNVLRGEMSLVGPRPPMPEEVKLYNAWHRKRLGIKPGITGLWQVSGRSDLDFNEWVRLDVYYIENWSLWLDFIIVLKTLGVVVKGRGAY